MEPHGCRRQLNRLLQGAFVSTLESQNAGDGQGIAPRKAMIKPLIIMAVAVAVILGGIFGWQHFIGTMTKKYMAAAATAPQTVSTIVAAAAPWQAQLQATGNLRAVRGADLAAQASGIVDEISFESGNDVPAGKLLLRLKPNDDYARLQQLQAAAELADQTYKRDQEQFAAQAVSQAVLDTDSSTAKSAHAQVAAQQALIEEKIVKAPFAGRVGIRQVDIGQYLTAGTTIVTLQALDPMLIDFYVPQQALAQLKAGQAVSAAVDTYPGAAFSRRDRIHQPENRRRQPQCQVRASFRNADKRLLPGMYASVRIDSGAPASFITLPLTRHHLQPVWRHDIRRRAQRSRRQGQAPPVVQQRFVKLGATRGDQIAILDGLKNGEVVVAAGQMKLRNGTAVDVNNTLLPANDASPNPPERIGTRTLT